MDQTLSLSHFGMSQKLSKRMPQIKGTQRKEENQKRERILEILAPPEQRESKHSYRKRGGERTSPRLDTLAAGNDRRKSPSKPSKSKQDADAGEGKGKDGLLVNTVENYEKEKEAEEIFHSLK